MVLPIANLAVKDCITGRSWCWPASDWDADSITTHFKIWQRITARSGTSWESGIGRKMKVSTGGGFTIDASGQVKVADFGIARMMSASETQTGVLLGTPSYMSPEQVQGRPVDARSDVFSFGVVLYEMVTGKRPFPVTNLVEAARFADHLGGPKTRREVRAHDQVAGFDAVGHRLEPAAFQGGRRGQTVAVPPPEVVVFVQEDVHLREEALEDLKEKFGVEIVAWVSAVSDITAEDVDETLVTRKLVDGNPQVRIHGDEYPVRARIHTVGGLSAHGDVDDLMRWLRNFNSDPAVHVVHGESESKQAFRDSVVEQLGLRADVPNRGDVLEL